MEFGEIHRRTSKGRDMERTPFGGLWILKEGSRQRSRIHQRSHAHLAIILTPNPSGLNFPQAAPNTLLPASMDITALLTMIAPFSMKFAMQICRMLIRKF